MPPGRTLTLSFPPFTPWVKKIVIACVGIYFLQVVLGAVAPGIKGVLELYGGLVPVLVLRYGMVWQLVTYAFLHASVGHVLINMLILWMFGAQQEQDWGSRKFLEFYLFCVVGAALTTIAVAYSPIPGVSPGTSTIGASGGVYGVLAAFGLLYGDREIFMFPLPFMMKAKYMVLIMVLLVVIATFQPGQGVANFAHLGGLLFGFLYVKFVPRRGLTLGASEKYFSLRNSYYRWRRRRAARKFEVYMSKHDRKVTFDEHGNYVHPDEMDKKNGGSKSGWVN
jgi:membrane associated rhomboid family serine protease